MKTSYSYSQIWNVAYPILLTLLVQNIIQVIDTAFLGRVGEVELGASAIAGIYYIAIFIIAFGFSTGSQILIGRRNGEKNYNQIGEIVIWGMVFLWLMALGIFLFTRLFSEPILSRILTSESIRVASIEYLDWRIYGIFFSTINVMFRAFFVGTTNTKILTLNAIVMALTNVLFDYLLIFGNWGFPEMGIGGAGLASVIAEAFSTLFFIIYVIAVVDFKKYGFTKAILNNFKVIKSILDVSLSLMIQYFVSLSTWLIFFLAIERMGETTLAVSNIIRSCYMILALPIQALSATANTLISNTMGAKRQEEVISLIWKITQLTLAIVSVFLIIIGIFPKLTISIYTSDTNLINQSISSLYVILGMIPVMAIGSIIFSSVSGTGNTRTALVIECSTLAIYIFWMWLTAIYWQSSLAVCWTVELVYAFFIGFFSFIYFKRGNWESKKL